MALEDISFEGVDIENPNKDNVDGNNGNDNHHDDSVDIDTGKTGDIDTDKHDDAKDDNPDNKDDKKDSKEKDNNADKVDSLKEGDTVEFDGNEYTVDANGNLVDKDGKIFKENKDLKEWLANYDTSDNNNDDSDLTIENVMKLVGEEISDDKGNPIQFSNTPEGVKSYIDAVINLKSDEIRQGTINKFYASNPLVKQFVDYVQVTGTARGFGELPDRTGIELDKDNEAQLEAVIKMAAVEFGNKSLNDNYIKYLKSTGSLYNEAKAQLEALQNKDKETRKNIETQAAAAREQERQEVENYFKKVNSMIVNRKIGNYTLPETITKEQNGQKLTLTLDDFYDYVASAKETDSDGNPMTGYQKDLNNQSDDELLAKELIDAWLLFTGGSYKDLINMVAKEETVRKLVIKSKENRNRHEIRIKPKQSKGNINDIVL